MTLRSTTPIDDTTIKRERTWLQEQPNSARNIVHAVTLSKVKAEKYKAELEETSSIRKYDTTDKVDITKSKAEYFVDIYEYYIEQRIAL